MFVPGGSARSSATLNTLRDDVVETVARIAMRLAVLGRSGAGGMRPCDAPPFIVPRLSDFSRDSAVVDEHVVV